MAEIIALKCPSCGGSTSQNASALRFGLSFTCEYCSMTSVLIRGNELCSVDPSFAVCQACGDRVHASTRMCLCGVPLLSDCRKCSKQVPVGVDTCPWCRWPQSVDPGSSQAHEVEAALARQRVKGLVYDLDSKNRDVVWQILSQLRFPDQDDFNADRVRRHAVDEIAARLLNPESLICTDCELWAEGLEALRAFDNDHARAAGDRVIRAQVATFDSGLPLGPRQVRWHAILSFLNPVSSLTVQRIPGIGLGLISLLAALEDAIYPRDWPNKWDQTASIMFFERAKSALWSLGEGASEAEQPLLELLRNKKPLDWAISALGTAQCNSESAIELLIKFARERNVTACRVLGQMGRTATPSLPVLIDVVDSVPFYSSGPPVGNVCARAIVSIDPDGRCVAELLRRLEARIRQTRWKPEGLETYQGNYVCETIVVVGFPAIPQLRKAMRGFWKDRNFRLCCERLIYSIETRKR